MEWIKLEDKAPNKDMACLVKLKDYKYIQVLDWDNHYQIWGDCEENKVEFYIPFDELPDIPSEGDLKMKRYSREANNAEKCAYCGKNTRSCDSCFEKGIEIRIYAHPECRQNNIAGDFRNSINIMKTAIERFIK